MPRPKIKYPNKRERARYGIFNFDSCHSDLLTLMNGNIKIREKIVKLEVVTEKSQKVAQELSRNQNEKVYHIQHGKN